MIELLSNFRPKKPPGPPRTHRPSFNAVRVAPHQIAKGPFVRNFNSAVDCAHLIEGSDFRAEASVDAENFIVHNCGDGQIIEHLCAVFPGVRVSVFPHALVVETVDLRDLTGLVISAEEGDVLGVAGFEGKQKDKRFD